VSLVVLAALVYGYVYPGKPGPNLIGVANRTLWDWLNLLYKPIVKSRRADSNR
jgi:hypothetical protein